MFPILLRDLSYTSIPDYSRLITSLKVCSNKPAANDKFTNAVTLIIMVHINTNFLGMQGDPTIQFRLNPQLTKLPDT